MATFKITKKVDAPIEKVFEKFSDFARAAHHVEGIVKVEMLTEPPVNVGTRFKETRVMFGREATEEMRVTEFEPNRKYTVTADSCGAKFESTFRFTPVGSGTQVEMEMLLTPVSLFAKLMAPLGNRMMGRVMKKAMECDMDQIKSACEQLIQS